VTPPEPWPIPSSWKWTVTGEIADVVGGGTPSSADPANFAESGVAWLTPADLSGYREKRVLRGRRDLSPKGLSESSARLVPVGTVLPSSRAPIGYVAIAANELATNQGFKSFILHDGLVPDYVYYYLLRAKDLAVALASGTTFLELSGARAAQVPLPVAPANEQPRVVEAIESLLPRLDEAAAGARTRPAQPEAVPSRGPSGGRRRPAGPDRGRAGPRRGPFLRASVRAAEAHHRRAAAATRGDRLEPVSGK
jgi:hypothetical protein